MLVVLLQPSRMRRLLRNNGQRLGATLARFHVQGVKHADLNAHNIVFDLAHSIHVLDFDRGGDSHG